MTSNADFLRFGSLEIVERGIDEQQAEYVAVGADGEQELFVVTEAHVRDVAIVGVVEWVGPVVFDVLDATRLGHWFQSNDAVLLSNRTVCLFVTFFLSFKKQIVFTK